ncbi:hypothetical protein DL93DRAFT_2081345 [Clavulina sp. PMI_390]|nr:hypothetical protein DL93DRAFT_2081345 [Clavulina sp. PMI_390]
MSSPRGRGRSSYRGPTNSSRGGRRGSHAPGYRGGGRGGGWRSDLRATPGLPIDHKLGTRIEEVQVDSNSAKHPIAAVENVVPVASYTWMDKPTPTISIPSKPPQWTPRKLPIQCTLDQGQSFIYQNAYRMPDSPLTPVVEAVRYYAPDFDLSSIDVVTDRNNLRKLIGWAQGSKDTFRIDLQRAGNGTVLFIRWEDRNVEPAQRSYAKDFERKMTKPRYGLEQHHRIVTYDFAELNLLVRFELDAYVETESSVDDPLNVLISQTNSLSLENSHGPPNSQSQDSQASNGLTIIPSENKDLVDQKDLIEMATRSVMNRANFNWLKKYPQLYLSETPTLLLAVHENGNFTSIEKFAADDKRNAEVRKAREEMQPGLNKLAAVLGAMRDRVLELTDDDANGSRRDRLLALVANEDGKLTIYERNGGPKLPESLVELF